MFTSRFSPLVGLLVGPALLLFLGSCKKDDDPKPQTPANQCATYQTVEVTAAITAPTTWNSCTIYVVDRRLDVSAPLTIQPGAIVKFGTNANLMLRTNGRITATGQANWPVVFTSLKDDARGGDTNHNGTATVPAAGDWLNVASDGLAGTGSTFTYCEFRYGGAGTSDNSTLDLSTASMSVQNCLFVDNKGGAPQYNGALDATQAKAGTIVKGNTFYRNGLPMHAGINFGIDDSNVFHNPLNAAEKNQLQGIWVTNNNSTGTVADWTWAETEVPYVTAGFDYSGGAWTLGAGVTVKFKPQGYLQLHDGARILAQGTATQPVTFTSINDDATGGDTNADGTTTTPAKKDWKSINLNAVNGSTFAFTRFFYGGGGLGATLDCGGAAAFTVQDCTFAHNGSETSIETRAAIDAARAAAGTVLQRNVFYDNVRPLSISASFDLDDSNVFHNPQNAAEKNRFQGIYLDWDNNVVANHLTWGESEVAYVAINHYIDLADGKSLTLGNGVTIKFYPNLELTLRDSDAQLVNHANASFTSVKDDSRGGDSNGDGATSLPAANDWRGVYTDNVPGVWHQWANIFHDSH